MIIRILLIALLLIFSQLYGYGSSPFDTQLPETNSSYIRPSILSSPITNVKIISNLIIDRGLSNWVSTNTNIVFIFYDPFQPLQDIETPDDLQLALADLIIPLESLQISNTMTPWKKKVYLSGIKMMTAENLQEFSEKTFFRQYNQKLYQKKAYTDEENSHLVKLGFEQWETKVIVAGWVTLRTGYGMTLKNENLQQPITGISPGINLNQNMRVNIVGKIGERVTVTVNHNSDNPDNEYEIAYKALETDNSFLRELRAGNVYLNVPQSSHFVKYNGTSKDSYGLKAVFQVGDFNLQSVFNLTTSKKGYKKYIGTKRLDRIELQDISYAKRRFYLFPDHSIDSGSVELLVSTSQPSIASRLIDSHYFIKLVEGRDYFVNNSTGEMNLTNSLDRNNDLVVRYTSGGAFFSTNSNSVIGKDNNNGDQFLYLWKSGWNFSQYIHDGYYPIGYQNFDPSRGFSFTVLYTSDRTKIADKQFLPTEYSLNNSSGMLKFKNLYPFAPQSDIYTNASDPDYHLSIYTIQITIMNYVKSYQLDYGILPGTERVILNGRQMDPSEYTIIYSTGELLFTNPSLINDSDVIEIYYEYKPFWSGSQKLGVATRLDWKPNNLINLGSSMIYNISQRDTGAPNIAATPDGVFLADLDGSLNLARIFHLKDEYELILRGEYALSVYDPNTVDYAIVDDFENSGDIFSISKNENYWILSSPDTNISGLSFQNRGKLLYKDYRNYNLDGSYSLIDFNSILSADKIKVYSFKPGPYLVLGGHLNQAQYPNVSQTSLAFDYQFDSGQTWVGAAISVAGPAGMDLSRFNEISFWAKLQSDENEDNTYEDGFNNSVSVYLSAGLPNEDSDGDGIMESEIDRSQAGYDFHDPNHNTVLTHVGGGRLGQGDGYIQSEDLNQDSVLETNQQTLLFPSPDGYTDITNAVIREGAWQRVTINIHTLSQEQLAILQHSSAVGLYIKNISGHKGRLIVDSIEFKSVSWSEKRIDGIRADDSSIIEGESVSVFNSAIYQKNRFYIPQSGDSNTQTRATLFEKLHGSKSVSEASQLNEKSLSLIYNLTNATINTNSSPFIGGMSGYLVKRTSVAYDLSKHQYISFFFFVPDSAEDGTSIKSFGDTYSDEAVSLILANSDRYYYKWRIPLDRVSKNAWHEAKVQIKKNLEMIVDGNSISGFEHPISYGFPNMKDINAVMLGTELTSTNEPVNKGVIWFDEMYAYSDELSIGTAYYVNPVFEYKKPLLSWSGFEILGPLTLKSSYENKDVNFVAGEGTKSGSYSETLNWQYGSRLLKDVNYNVSYDQNRQGSSTNEIESPRYLQWNQDQNTTGFNLFYPGRDYIPSVTHSYTETYYRVINRNLMSDVSNDFILNTSERQFADSMKICLNQNIPIIKGLSISPRAGFEDSYILLDRSNYTNDILPVYLTNTAILGMKDLKKTVNAGMTFSLWNWSLSGDFAQTIQRAENIYTMEGFRSDFGIYDRSLIFDRYEERVQSASQGFTFPITMLDKFNSDSYSFILSGNKPIELFSVWTSDKISRTASGYSYDNTGAIITKSENYTLGSDGRLYLYPKFLFLNTIQFRVNRSLAMDYNAELSNLSYRDILNQWGDTYYAQPLQYNGFFGGITGRTNSLNLISRFSNGIYESTPRYSDGLELEWNFYNFPVWLDPFFPKQYTFSTYLTTGRTYSSFYQNLDNQFTASLPLKISEWGVPFLTPNNDYKPGDLLLNFRYRDLITYNDRKIADSIGGDLTEILTFNRNVSLSFSYILLYTTESYLKKTEDFEKQYGWNNAVTNLSPMRKYSHTGNIILNWSITGLRDWNLIITKVNLRGSGINNQEGISVTSDVIAYDGSRFIRYQQKVVEATLDHSTEIKITDYITGNFMARVVVNQYAEITPLNNDIKTTYFQPGFGAQLGCDLKIKF